MGDTNESPVLVSTGCPGLDVVLDGGLPEHHVYLLEGRPGTGKTTLGLQFLLEGAKQGETVLFIALSERSRDIEQIASSHDWTPEGLTIHEYALEDKMEENGHRQTLFATVDLELPQRTDEILQLTRELNPSRIVIDSVAELRILADSETAYRREIFSLIVALNALDCTTVFIDSGTLLRTQSEHQDLVHGVISLEVIDPDYGRTRRRVRVRKMRGQAYRSGYHDFQILKGGLEVHPRLVRRLPEDRATFDKMPSGVPALDKLLNGGMDTGSSSLVIGPSGTGKTTVSSLYAIEAAKRGLKSHIYLFDERKPTFFQRLRLMGLGIDDPVEKGLIEIEEVDAGETSPGEFANICRRAVDEDNSKLIIIDSMQGYLQSMPFEKNLITHMHDLLTFLSRQDVLSIIVVTQQGIMDTASVDDAVNLSYLADTVVLIRHFEAFGKVRKAISVVKKRTDAHENTIREVRIGDKGVEVGDPLRDFTGILSGPIRFTGQKAELLDDNEMSID